jgi:hypothetical protein
MTNKISGNNTRKTFNRFSTKNSCTRNITHYKESATIRNLTPEWWGSPLVQEEKYREKPLKREEEIINNNNNNNNDLPRAVTVIKYKRNTREILFLLRRFHFGWVVTISVFPKFNFTYFLSCFPFM